MELVTPVVEGVRAVVAAIAVRKEVLVVVQI